MKQMFKKTMLAATCAVAMGGISQSVLAADWLMIQGTEKPGQSARARVWGFIQAQYQQDNSDANSTGTYAPPKLIGPDLESRSAFNINRARIGVRGTGMPLDSNVNYFFLVEFGNNAITNPGKSFAKITDASVTLNHFKEYGRVRVGQFKIPMAEEIYQGIALFDYVNFTEGTNQLLLERTPNIQYKNNISTQAIPVATALNGFENSVAAARGIGVQLFNTIKVAPTWEVGYSFMVENGNGINTSDNNGPKDRHFYFNLTKVYKGVGPRRQDWKTFAWYTTGKRDVNIRDDSGSTPTYAFQRFDRTRYGVGTKYYKLPFRVTAEWMRGKGVIFQGPHKPNYILADGVANSTTNSAAAKVNHFTSGLRDDAQATSWYIEGAYIVPKTKWEFDLRIARFNRLEDTNAEVEFKNTTVGVQYHLNKKTRLAVNIESRNYEAIGTATPVPAALNNNLSGVDKRYSIQLTHIF